MFEISTGSHKSESREKIYTTPTLSHQLRCRYNLLFHFLLVSLFDQILQAYSDVQMYSATF